MHGAPAIAVSKEASMYATLPLKRAGELIVHVIPNNNITSH